MCFATKKLGLSPFEIFNSHNLSAVFSSLGGLVGFIINLRNWCSRYERMLLKIASSRGQQALPGGAAGPGRRLSGQAV